MSDSTLPALAQRVRYRTKQEFVYQTLRDAIMRCELEPGRRLVIDDEEPERAGFSHRAEAASSR